MVSSRLSHRRGFLPRPKVCTPAPPPPLPPEPPPPFVWPATLAVRCLWHDYDPKPINETTAFTLARLGLTRIYFGSNLFNNYLHDIRVEFNEPRTSADFTYSIYRQWWIDLTAHGTAAPWDPDSLSAICETPAWDIPAADAYINANTGLVPH